MLGKSIKYFICVMILFSILGSNVVFATDITPPTIPDIIPLHPKGYVSGTWVGQPVEFVITNSTDKESGVDKYEYRTSLNGGAFSSWTTYINPITISESGTTQIEARAVDKLENISSVSTFEIKIDRPPTGTVVINNGAATTESTQVTLTITATDDLTSVTQMQFSNDGINWSNPEPYATTKQWTLEEGDGIKTVFIKLCDTQGNWSNSYVYGVGHNVNGQLGIGGCMETTPVQTWNISDVKAISAGYEYTVALKEDGTVWAWGNNQDGQLGDNTTTKRHTPVQVKGAGGAGNLEGVKAISAGESHTVALKEDGTVWAWGYNSYGRLGDNTTTNRRTPIQVKGEGGIGNLEGVKVINAGYSHTVALKGDGTVWAWGYNSYGQLGDNTTTNRSTPVQVKGEGGVGYLQGVTDISAGYYHTMFVTGARDTIILSAPKDTVPPTEPTIEITSPEGYVSGDWTNQDATFTITDGTDETEVSRSEYRTSLDGGAWSEWTIYSAPVTVTDTGTTLVEARTVDNAENISEVTTVTINIDKLAPTAPEIQFTSPEGYTSGEWTNQDVKFTITNGTDTDSGVQKSQYSIDGGTTWVDYSTEVSISTAGTSNVAARTVDNAGNTSAMTEVVINIDNTAPTGSIVINNGDETTESTQVTLTISATDDVGTVTYMQFSNDGVTWSEPEPYATTKEWTLSEGDGIKTVIAKFRDDAGNCSVSYVYAAGKNKYGQLGDGTQDDKCIPVKVKGEGGIGYLEGVKTISAGYEHTVALKGDGTVWAWGRNQHGYLGDSTTTEKSTPVQVKGVDGVGFLEDIKEISAGWSHTVALKEDGTVWAWGNNVYGQLGDNTTINKLTPVQVRGVDGVGFLEDIKEISAGWFHTVALKEDGTVWAWGSNEAGQLGDNIVLEKCTPIQIRNEDDNGFLEGVKAISAGQYHTVVLKWDGTAWAWGDNTCGQLGDNTIMYYTLTPVQVKGKDGIGYLEDIKAMSAGSCHTVALAKDGTVYAWGDNTYGQLGDNTDTNRRTPVQVKGVGGVGTLEGVTAISAGYGHTVALKEDGTVWAWGWNYCGELGDGTTTKRRTPIQVIGIGGEDYLEGVIDISAGYAHTMFVTGIQDTITLTTTTPKPSTINVSAINENGTYGTGSILTLTATFDKEITVDTALGTPTLTLETGDTDRVATYLGITGTNTLLFEYIVQKGDAASDLDYVSADSLQLNGAVIKDTEGKDVTVALPLPGVEGSLSFNKDIIIDTTGITEGPWTNHDVIFIIEGSEDGGSPVEIRNEYRTRFNEGVPSNWELYTEQVTISASGITDLEARTVSAGGNTSLIDSIRIRIDKIAPELPEIKFISPEGYTSGGVTANDVNFEIIDGSDGEYSSGVNRTEYRMRYSADGLVWDGWSSWTNYITGMTITTEGITEIEARTIDNVENVSEVAEFSIRISRQVPGAPTINFTSPSGYKSGNLSEEPVTFTITHGVDNSGVGIEKSQYRIRFTEDGTEWEDWSDWITYTGGVTIIKEGTTEVEARTIDLAENVGEVTEATIIIDAEDDVFSGEYIIRANKTTEPGYIYDKNFPIPVRAGAQIVVEIETRDYTEKVQIALKSEDGTAVALYECRNIGSEPGGIGIWQFKHTIMPDEEEGAKIYIDKVMLTKKGSVYTDDVDRYFIIIQGNVYYDTGTDIRISD